MGRAEQKFSSVSSTTTWAGCGPRQSPSVAATISVSQESNSPVTHSTAI
jgi:hypothetical protein